MGPGAAETEGERLGSLKQGICFLGQGVGVRDSANLIPGQPLDLEQGCWALLLFCLPPIPPLPPHPLAWCRTEERVIDCPEEVILILEGFCIMKEMSIRKELTQIIRFLIERMGEGVF